MRPEQANDKEKQNNPNGFERLLEQNLYGNVRFPQTYVAILGYTLNAIVTDPHPKERLIEYLSAPFPDHAVAELLRTAERAHRAFLPEARRPKLDLDRMRGLWEDEQDRVYIMGIGINLPPAISKARCICSALSAFCMNGTILPPNHLSSVRLLSYMETASWASQVQTLSS